MTRPIAWTVIPYEPSWRRHVLELMALIQPGGVSEAEFVWWFERNPTKYLNISLAECEGHIIGISSTEPVRVWCEGAEHIVPIVLNVVTHPDYRGQGIFSALESANEADAKRNGCPFMLSFPSTPSMSMPIFVNRLGWASGTVLRWTAKVLNPAAALRAAFGLRAPAWLDAGLGAVCRATLRKGLSAAVQPIDEFDASFDRLWEKERPCHRWGLVKDSAYLTWRFLEAPSGRYQCWRIVDGRAVVGYLVTGTVEKKGLRLGFIADLFVPAGAGGLVEAALRTADGWFAHRDVDAVLSFAPAGAADSFRYLRFGYFPTPKRLHLIYKILDPRFSDVPLAERSRWDFTVGDLDFF